MSIKEEITAPDRNIPAELDDLAKKAEALAVSEELSKDYGARKAALLDYFYLIRYADAFGVLSQSELDARMGDWSGEMIRLSATSPHTAYMTAYEALEMCMRNENGLLVCDKIVLNTVCVHINANMSGAIYSHLKHMGYFEMSKVDMYLVPLINVLTVTAEQLKSPDLQTTFFEALTQLENTLYSNAVHPLHRFEVVTKLKSWADKREGAGALAFRMHEILEEATFLPDGRGMLLCEIELQAERLGRESREFYATQTVDITKAFAIKAGVAPALAGIHKKIERALAEGRAKDAENALTNLFFELGQDGEDADGNVTEDLHSYKYFFDAASRLAGMSITNGSRLGHRCIAAMEGDLTVSEGVMASVHEYALIAMMNEDIAKSGQARMAIGVYKTIMKWSSGFEEIENADEILDCATGGYEQCLMTLQPIERYDDVAELVAWVDDCEYPSPYLQAFTQRMMSDVVVYGNKKGIRLECDTYNPAHEVKTLELVPR